MKTISIKSEAVHFSQWRYTRLFKMSENKV